MKKYMLLAILAGGFLACKGTKNATSVSKSNDSDMVGKVNKINENDAVQANSKTKGTASSQSKKRVATNTETTSTSTTLSPAGRMDSQINGATGAMDNAGLSPSATSGVSDANLKMMYKNLQMTDVQISTFEKSMENFKEAVKRDAHGEMLGTIGNEQERQLKKILSEKQWNNYLLWKKN